MANRQILPEETQLEEDVTSLWNKFLVVLQEAMDFVNFQTPLIIQSLDAMLKVPIFVEFKVSIFVELICLTSSLQAAQCCSLMAGWVLDNLRQSNLA